MTVGLCGVRQFEMNITHGRVFIARQFDGLIGCRYFELGRLLGTATTEKKG